MTEESLFLAALDHTDPAARRRFLDDACAHDPDLRQRLDLLLAAFAAGRHKLEPPTAATADFQPRAEPGIVVADRYKLVEPIGEGGMGEVWVAKQTEPVQRKVALKLIKPGMDSKSVLTRFEAERQALAMMDHPNIAKVLDGGLAADGRPFFVMELVNGQPLTRFCDEARLTPRQRLELFLPVCQAVQHAHQKGIVHRDLKPSNILVTLYDGKPVPKVIDFGVAKATGGRLTDQTVSTQFGAVVGTFEYMAPEQAGFSALDVDTRADIYSLGVILYELLTGLRPFDGARLRKAAIDELFRILREEDPPRPSTKLSTDASLPSAAAVRGTDPKRLTALMKGELDWIVMKCLEKDRGRRYETASGLARDVQRYLSDEPVEARPPSPGYRARKFVRRNRGRVVAGLLVLLALVAGVVGTTAGLVAARGQRDAARAAREQAEADREVARNESRRAEGEAERARRARQEAEASLARSDGLRLGSEAAVARATDPGLAFLLGLEAVRRYPHHLTYRALDEAAADLRERRAVKVATGQLAGARLRPDRALVYWSSFTAESAAVVDLATGKSLAARTGSFVGLADADWSPDGTRAVGVPGGRVTVAFTDGRQPDRATFTERVAVVWDTATGRDLVHLRRHDDTVVSARFSPDGRTILTASWDGTARLWDAATGKERHVLRPNAGSLVTALFSPDGRRVLTVGAGQWQTAFKRDPATGRWPPDTDPNPDPGLTGRPYRSESASTGGGDYGPQLADPVVARLWDAETGRPVGALSLVPAAVSRLAPSPWRPRVAAFTPDGGGVVVGFDDGLVGMWAAADGADPVAVTEPIGAVTALAFSPDGSRLAAAGEGGPVAVWDTRTGRREHLLAGHLGAVTAVAFSDLGRRLVTAGTDKTARVWEARTGTELAVLRGHTGKVVAAAFLDPDTVVTAGDDTIRTWSLAPPPPVATRLSEPDPPGGRLGKLLGKPPARHRQTVTALAFAADGRSVFTGSDDRTVRQWDPDTGRQLAELPGRPRGPVRALRVGPGGAVYVGEDASPFPEPVVDRETHLSGVHRWDPTAGRAGRFLKGQNTSAVDLDLSPDGRRLIVFSGQAELSFRANPRHPNDLDSRPIPSPRAPLSVWDTATGERLWSGPPVDQHEDRPRPRFSPDGTLVVYRTERPDELALYDAGTGAVVRPLARPVGARGVVSNSASRAPRWDAARFSPDGRVVVGHGQGAPEVWFWDAATGAVLGSFEVPGQSFLFEPALAFTPDSRRLVLAVDRAVYLVDVATRTQAAVLRGHEALVRSLAVSPDGTRLLTGSEDRTAALWDVATGRLLTVYRGHSGSVGLVAFSPDGSRVATAGSGDLFARVWSTDLVSVFERRKPRELTAAERVRYELPAAGRE